VCNLHFAMDEFKDLYITYLNNNEDEDNQMSELEFFKLAFKGAMDKMDELRQVCVLNTIILVIFSNT